MSHRPGNIFQKLYLSGSLLYIGLSLLIDPPGMARLPNVLAHDLRNFELALRGLPPEQPLPEWDHRDLSPFARNGLRLAGLALTVCALLVVIFG